MANFVFNVKTKNFTFMERTNEGMTSCKSCGKLFQAIKSGHKYCSDSCRAAAFRDKKQVGNVTDEKISHKEDYMMVLLEKMDSMSKLVQLLDVENQIKSINQNIQDLKSLNEQTKSSLVSPYLNMINEKVKAVLNDVRMLATMKEEIELMKNDIGIIKSKTQKLEGDMELCLEMVLKVFYDVSPMMMKICPELAEKRNNHKENGGS